MFMHDISLENRNMKTISSLFIKNSFYSEIPMKSAYVGLAEVVSVVVAILKRYFRQYILICPDEGFIAETLTEILNINT